MILPLDIFTLIIEELVATIPDLYYPVLDRHRGSLGGWIVEDFKAAHEQTLKTLKAICLTCKALVPFSQREIFAAIRFESGPAAEEKWRMVANLDRLLQQSPHLSDYIRNVYFADDSRDHPKYKLISRVLLKLHNVRVFDLDQGCYSSGGNWRQFPDRVAFAIRNIIKLPSLRVLRMSFIKAIPPEILRGTPQLQRLILCQCSWPKSPNINAAIEPPTIEPSISSGTTKQKNPIQTIQPTESSVVQPIFGPKTLAVEIASNEDVKFVLKLAKIAGELRHLKWFIHPGWTFAGLSKVLSTGVLQTLTTLSVSAGPIYAKHHWGGLNVEIWLMPKHNVLRSLTFTFHCPFQIAFLNLEQFREIDTAITTDRFPCLTEIRFHFIVLHSSLRALRYDISEWSGRYQANFPLLTSRKDIDFQCSLEALQFNFLNRSAG